jgi:succinate-semialdehyde dehydrogenase/glutarate-semialdehyde dehydrogenase
MDRAIFPIKLNNPDLLRTQSYIDGKWVDATDGGRFAVDNPATGSDIAHVANLVPQQAEDAIAAANRAFPAWRQRPLSDLAQVV